MSTAAYALFRRSTSAQDLSIEQQRTGVQAWASAHGYHIVREFADDASGLDTRRRRQFQDLLQLCADPARRAADFVLCYDVSRFSRLDPDEAAYHEHSLRRVGVRVIYTHDPLVNESGVGGQIVKTLQRVFAHEYSQKLSQLVQRGHRAHAARGEWSGGRAPYGYRRALVQADGSLLPLASGRWKAHGETIRLVIDSVEAAVVREIFEDHVMRERGVRAIAGQLSARSIAAPAGGRSWSKHTVWAILHNPIYRGALVWGRAKYRQVGQKHGKQRQPINEQVIVEGAVPAIVAPPRWHAAQDTGRPFASGRSVGRPYVLAGLIRCVGCGHRFQAQRRGPGEGRTHYLCGGYVNGGRAVCSSPSIPAEYLETAVLDGIEKRLDRLLDRGELQVRLEALLSATASGQVTPDQLDARLHTVQRKIGRLVTVLTAGHEPLPAVREALVGLERERERLELERKAARSVTDTKARDDILKSFLVRLASVRSVLAAGEPEERKAIVRSFIESIQVEVARGRIVLRWFRLPQDESVKLVAAGGLEPPTRGL